MKDCLICQRVALAERGQNPYVIAEMKHTFFVAGDHQFHRGYALVLLKDHFREPFDLSPEVQAAHFVETMRAARAVQATFAPWKLNFSCYGNGDPHVHWHIWPRYEDDPDRGNHPWKHAARFGEAIIDTDEARRLAAEIRSNFD